jgi:hypothetical protein
MKVELNGIGSNLSSGDFGEMGISLNPLNWFSSPKTFTRQQNIAAANGWLLSVYNALRPNASYSLFIEALKLNNYSTPISEEDFQDFLDTIGFNVNTSPAIAEKVKAAIVKAYSSNKNMLPNRKNIVSAFLNPDVVKWTYWDATKMTTKQIATSTVETAKTVANVASATVSGIKYVPHIIVGAAFVVGYILFKNRKEVGRRLTEKVTEKTFSAVGLGK